MSVRLALLLIGAVALLLAACAPAATPTHTPTPTVAPTATPTPTPTPAYDLTCPISPQDVRFATPLSDADAVRLAVLSGCYAAPGRGFPIQATRATITTTTWGDLRPTLGD